MAEYVPLLQTLVWPVFLAILIAVFRGRFLQILETLRKRIEEGSSLKAGPIEIGENLKALDYAPPSDKQQPGMEQWEQERTAIYRDNHGHFLAHVITPSRKHGQKYDIFIYLIRHKTSDLSDVEYAEFLLGHMWGNRVFREEVKEGMVGMSTSAYGPFLCICRVHLKDGSVVKLDRYIDFEMGDMLHGAGK
jgi:hypothetical protein